MLLVVGSDLIRVTLSVAADVGVHASFVDKDGSTFTADRKNTLITSSGAHTIVPGPGASRVRNVKQIVIRNTDAVDATEVVVEHVGAVGPELARRVLGPGHALCYLAGKGWYPC